MNWQMKRPYEERHLLLVPHILQKIFYSWMTMCMALLGFLSMKLCQNNYENKGCTMSILENFIGGRAGDETVIPVFENNSGIPEIIELISYK